MTQTEIPETVKQWLADFDTYKTFCEKFRKRLFRKRPKNENHALKSILGIEEHAKLLTKLLPTTHLQHGLERKVRQEINQYLKEHEKEILENGYVSEETILNHKSKTSTKGGTFIKAVSYLPTTQGPISITNFVKILNSQKDYEAAIAAEERLAPLFPDIILKHSYKDDNQKIIAYRFIGKTLFDALKETEQKTTLADKAAKLLAELHVKGQEEAEKLQAPNYTQNFTKCFFKRAGIKATKEIIDLFKKEIATTLEQEPQSLIHADAKTNNFLITSEGKTLLIDLELISKDNIHYDLYKLIDSAGLNEQEEQEIVNNTFERLQGFYKNTEEQFNKAYRLTKIVGDLGSAARFTEVSKNYKDENKQLLEKIAAKYCTRALKALEHEGMHDLSLKLRQQIRDSGKIEILPEEEYELITTEYDPGKHGLTTLLVSENAKLRFPRPKPKRNWLRKAGIAAGLIGFLAGAPAMMGQKTETPKAERVVDLEPMINIDCVQPADMKRIFNERTGEYHLSIPMLSHDGQYMTSINRDDHWSAYNYETIPVNPTILTNWQFNELFENKTKEVAHETEHSRVMRNAYHGLTKRVYDNIRKYSRDDMQNFSLMVRTVLFTNLVKTPHRQYYTEDNCSNLTLLPEYIYERYGYSMKDETFMDGRWIDLVSQYLADLLVQEKGNMTRAITAYYNHHLYGDDIYSRGMTKKERKRMSFYNFNEKEDCCMTRYESQLDEAQKHFTRQALIILGECDAGRMGF